MPDLDALRAMPDTEIKIEFRSFTLNGDPYTGMPEAATVGHAAAWAAERGYWDVATCLMELAQALAELETPAPLTDTPTAVEPRTWPIEAPPTVDATPPPPNDAPEGYCGHGYRVIVGRHVATNGICGADPVLDTPFEIAGRPTCECLGYEHAPICPEADDRADAS